MSSSLVSQNPYFVVHQVLSEKTRNLDFTKAHELGIYR